LGETIAENVLIGYEALIFYGTFLVFAVGTKDKKTNICVTAKDGRAEGPLRLRKAKVHGLQSMLVNFGRAAMMRLKKTGEI